MKKKHIKIIGTIVIGLLFLIFFLDLWRRTYQKKRRIMTHLHSVALYIHQYKTENNGVFPTSLDFIDSKIVPKNIIKHIKYTYPQRKLYSVNIPLYDYDGSDIWFYYPYGNKAWVCMDGGVLVNKIPLYNISKEQRLK